MQFHSSLQVCHALLLCHFDRCCGGNCRASPRSTVARLIPYSGRGVPVSTPLPAPVAGVPWAGLVARRDIARARRRRHFVALWLAVPVATRLRRLPQSASFHATFRRAAHVVRGTTDVVASSHSNHRLPLGCCSVPQPSASSCGRSCFPQAVTFAKPRNSQPRRRDHRRAGIKPRVEATQPRTTSCWRREAASGALASSLP